MSEVNSYVEMKRGDKTRTGHRAMRAVRCSTALPLAGSFLGVEGTAEASALSSIIAQRFI